MQRQYRFRAKRIDTGVWVYGDYFKTPLSDENSGTKPEAGWSFLSGETRHCIGCNGVAFVIDEKTLSEWTGLNDKHGTPIFEGDVVQCAHGNCRIEFGKWVSNNENNDDILGWMVIGEYSAHALDPQLSYWVIGNIYSNPELLKADM